MSICTSSNNGGEKAVAAHVPTDAADNAELNADVEVDSNSGEDEAMPAMATAADMVINTETELQNNNEAGQDATAHAPVVVAAINVEPNTDTGPNTTPCSGAGEFLAALAPVAAAGTADLSSTAV